MRKVTIMPNAIDIENFRFSIAKRNKIRSELNIEGKLVIGCVARFSPEKNHEFLLEIFKEIIHTKSESVLMLIGRGELEDSIKRKATELGIKNSILFLGVRNDVPDLLNAMDVFILPSLHEGLPVTLVEAQANGLPTWVADVVTNEVKIASNIHYMSLGDGAKTWSRSILSEKLNRNFIGCEFERYDIKKAADRMFGVYQRLACVEID